MTLKGSSIHLHLIVTCQLWVDEIKGQNEIEFKFSVDFYIFTHISCLFHSEAKSDN